MVVVLVMVTIRRGGWQRGYEGKRSKTWWIYGIKKRNIVSVKCFGKGVWCLDQSVEYRRSLKVCSVDILNPALIIRGPTPGNQGYWGLALLTPSKEMLWHPPSSHLSTLFWHFMTFRHTRLWRPSDPNITLTWLGANFLIGHQMYPPQMGIIFLPRL